MHMKRKFKLFDAMLLGGCVTALSMIGSQVIADQDPGTDDVPRLLPYNGTLYFDGDPVTAQGDEGPWLRFDITDGNADDSPVVYSQSMQVDAYNARFSAMLGPSDDAGVNLEQVLAGADDLYLKLVVLGEHDPDNPEATAGDDAALSNPQRLTLSPYAVWATNATDFTVEGQLDTNALEADTLTANDVTAGSAVFLTANGLNSRGDFDTFLSDLNDDVVFEQDVLATQGIGASIENDNFSDFRGSLRAGVFVRLSGREPYLLADQFTLDGLDGYNVTGGAMRNSDDEHAYISSRGASRLNFAQGGLTASVGGLNGQTAGSTISLTDMMAVSDQGVDFPTGPLSVDDVAPGSVAGLGTRFQASTGGVGGDLSVGTRLNLSDIDTDGDSSDGCTRVDDIQICWGNIPNHTNSNGNPDNSAQTISFRKAFGNANYAITTTCYEGGNELESRYMSVTSTANGSFGVRTWTASGNGSDEGGRFIAIGQAGSNW